MARIPQPARRARSFSGPAPAEGTDPRLFLLQLSAPEIAELCGVNHTTATRWQKGLSRVPLAALKLITFRVEGVLPRDDEPRESSRIRAARLRARMLHFHDIYNAAWFVRMAQHGAPGYHRQKVERFVSVLKRELAECRDPEALIFAVADSLTAFPRGLPWED